MIRAVYPELETYFGELQAAIHTTIKMLVEDKTDLYSITKLKCMLLAKHAFNKEALKKKQSENKLLENDIETFMHTEKNLVNIFLGILSNLELEIEKAIEINKAEKINHLKHLSQRLTKGIV